VRALGGPEGLAKLRQERQPGEDRWWWYLDRRVAARRQSQIRRIAWIVGGALVVLAVLGVLYVRFLRPDEATRVRYGYVLSGESALDRGEYEAALESYQRAFELAPDDPEVNLMIGLLNEVLENPEEASQGYARAEVLYGSRALFLAVRSQKYAFVGWYEKAEADAQAAIEADDQLALAYCALGGAVEGQGRIGEAIDAFQACADQARENGEDELYVIAATRLGMLLQMPSALDSPVDAPQPEDE
jgi:tetratricopeptide (TPR) repeat protein